MIAVRRARCRPTGPGPTDVARALDAAACGRADRGRAHRMRSRRRRWCGPDRRRGRRADGGAARRAGGVSVLRHGDPAGRRSRTRTICCEDRGALVRPELLTQLGTAVGERLLIGGQPFTIRGVIAQEPGRRVGAFSFGSRVLVDYDDLRATGLLAFGSRASYQILLRVQRRGGRPADARPPARLRATGSSTRARTGRPRTRSARTCMRAENYLSLVGFVMVVLGGIGVWSVTRVFVQQKIRSVAILKCLGATAGQVLATYVAPGGRCSALAGSLLGVALAGAPSRAIPASLAAAFGDVSVRPDRVGGAAGAARRAAGVAAVLRSCRCSRSGGSSRCCCCAALDARGPARRRARAPVATALAPAWLRRVDWSRSAPRSSSRAALVAVAAWQAARSVGADRLRRIRRRSRWCCMAPASAARARGRGRSPRTRGSRCATRSSACGGPATRRASSCSPSASAASSCSASARCRRTCSSQFSVQLQRGGADMFLIDIQQDQVDGVRALLRSAPASSEPRLIPVLRARVTGGSRPRASISRATRTCAAAAALGREYVDHLSRSPRAERDADRRAVLDRAGAAAGGRRRARSVDRASIHERFAHQRRRRRCASTCSAASSRPGSPAFARSSGRTRGTAASCSCSGPGPLERAPHTFIGILRAPEDPAARARFQRDLVAQYPNVSAIDVREVLATIQSVVDNVTLGDLDRRRRSRWRAAC